MFDYLNGTVARLAPYLAVIDCGGVGFSCHVSSRTLGQLSAGKPGKLFTYVSVREDAFELFGFSTEEERACFELLIGVSGVGPKAAISILSATTPESFTTAILTENEKILTAANGVGKKIAQRIILELKDKLEKGQFTAVESYSGASVVIPENKTSEAAAALSVLGYSQAEINLALRGIDTEKLTLEEIIRQALRVMAK